MKCTWSNTCNFFDIFWKKLQRLDQVQVQNQMDRPIETFQQILIFFNVFSSFTSHIFIFLLCYFYIFSLNLFNLQNRFVQSSFNVNTYCTMGSYLYIPTFHILKIENYQSISKRIKIWSIKRDFKRALWNANSDFCTWPKNGNGPILPELNTPHRDS